MAPKLLSLERLPEFASYPFDRKTDVPVFEVARVTKKTTPQTRVSYNLQTVNYIVGRTPDSTGVYYATSVMIRGEGIFAVQGDCAGVSPVNNIESYEVIIPHDKLLKKTSKRRI